MHKKTTLYAQHQKLGAKMVPFAGWEMPVSYPAGILAEHTAVRTSAGLFDVGHMGLIKIEGEDSLPFLQKVATNDASKLEANECQYAVLCNEAGGAIDDVLVYRLPMFYLIVCNASNMDKVIAWLKKQSQSFHSLAAGPYENYCMLSIQGPKAVGIVEKVLTVSLADLRHNHTLWWRDIILSRTGYTGEDGIEMIVAKKEVVKVWQSFLSAGVQPCGLGARDTLRLEAGLPLYGHEYDEQTSPLEVGYGWAVKFDKGDFVGREALLKQNENGVVKKLAGLEIEGRAIARQGDEVLGIGKVTSGTYSPTLKRPIAMAFITSDHAQLGNQVLVKIRENLAPAQVVAKSFYKR
ncbi:MAG: glycine cleavage system aminomethyltransferase GcvT [Candidatus Margulisbacteria bacterium]|nr:glycine cleavage system aminomethyltransferase GcvT [Candidatus Margulisiibacteriota bacterium]